MDILVEAYRPDDLAGMIEVWRDRTALTVRGHAGFSRYGSDIVCAAVTSAVRLVESTVNDVLGLAASVKVHERSGAVEFRLPGGLSATNENTCQALLTGLMLLFSELHSEYPDNIEVMEA